MFSKWNISQGLALCHHLHTHRSSYRRPVPCLLKYSMLATGTQAYEVLQHFAHSPLLINTHVQYSPSMWKAPGYWVLPFHLPLTCFHWIVLGWVSSCINVHAYLHISSACLCMCISVHTLLLSLAVREGERSGLALRIEWDKHISCLWLFSPNFLFCPNV